MRDELLDGEILYTLHEGPSSKAGDDTTTLSGRMPRSATAPGAEAFREHGACSGPGVAGHAMNDVGLVFLISTCILELNRNCDPAVPASSGFTVPIDWTFEPKFR